MENSEDLDLMALVRGHMTWIYSVSKKRINHGSTGQGLNHILTIHKNHINFGMLFELFILITFEP